MYVLVCSLWFVDEKGFQEIKIKKSLISITVAFGMTEHSLVFRYFEINHCSTRATKETKKTTNRTKRWFGKTSSQD